MEKKILMQQRRANLSRHLSIYSYQVGRIILIIPLFLFQKLQFCNFLKEDELNAIKVKF